MSTLKKAIFFHVVQQPLVGQGLHIIGASRSHSVKHTALSSTPLDEWSSRRRGLYLTTQHSQEADIHAPGGIRTHNPSKRAAADPRLRQRGQLDQQVGSMVLINVDTCQKKHSLITKNTTCQGACWNVIWEDTAGLSTAVQHGYFVTCRCPNDSPIIPILAHHISAHLVSNASDTLPQLADELTR
jgi:hypothetical protein